MSVCDDMRSLAGDWLDGTATSEQVRTIDTHVADCESCRSWFERYRRLDDDLSTLGLIADRLVEDSPWRTTSRVMGSKRPVEPTRRSYQFVWRIAAAIALVTVASIGLLSRSRPSKPPPIFVVDQTESSANEARFSAVVHTPGRLAARQPSKNPRVHVVWVFDELSQSSEEASSRPSSIGI